MKPRSGVVAATRQSGPPAHEMRGAPYAAVGVAMDGTRGEGRRSTFLYPGAKTDSEFLARMFSFGPQLLHYTDQPAVYRALPQTPSSSD